MTDPYSGQSGYQPQGPSGYQTPQFYPPVPGGYPGYFPPQRRTNGLAIASLVVSCASLFVCALLGCVGAVMGHVARRQIRESGEEGDGMALAGIIVGWILFGLSLLAVIAYAIFIGWMVSNGELPPPE
jgi:drug/metabolite transporter (DMT)-like permease